MPDAYYACQSKSRIKYMKIIPKVYGLLTFFNKTKKSLDTQYSFFKVKRSSWPHTVKRGHFITVCFIIFFIDRYIHCIIYTWTGLIWWWNDGVIKIARKKLYDEK